jgi:hypothetical protein
MYKKTDLEFSVRCGICDALYEKESIKCTSFEKKPYYQVGISFGKLAPGWVQVRVSLRSFNGVQTLRVMQGDGLGRTEKTLYETELVKGGLVDVKRLAAITDKVTDIIWEACYA